MKIFINKSVNMKYSFKSNLSMLILYYANKLEVAVISNAFCLIYLDQQPLPPITFDLKKTISTRTTEAQLSKNT